MKTQFKILFSAAAFLLGGTMALAQSDAEEVPGDNFSLEGALELFKKSASPQEFERLLNSPDSKVNNLDLNGDGQIDYVRVIDKNEGNVHAFIMQSVISNSESQDIAVIELEKRNDGSAVLQIVGDADVYGIETIIEPTEEVRVNAGASTARTVVNVWAWPSVQYVYGPSYSAWMSPWSWGYYPGWYRPWRPLSWYAYDPFWAPYRPYYSVCYRHRIAYAPVIYRPYRATSVIVYNRHHTQITNFRNTSTGYRHDRGTSYSRGRSNDNGRTRSSYSGSDNSRSYSNGRSSSNGRTSGATRTEQTNSRSRTSVQQPADNSSRPTRSVTPQQTTRPVERNGSNDRSVSHNNSRTTRQQPVQRQQSAPQQQFRRSETPSHNRSASPAPSHNRSSSPAPSRSGGGGSGGHSRRH